MASHAHNSDPLAHSADATTDHNHTSQAIAPIIYGDNNKSTAITNSIDPTDSTESIVPLHVHVERAVRQYFTALGDDLPTDLYELILMQVELPLLTVVLEQTRGNQSKCAQILGLNRGTLRKKLKTYGLMS